MIRIKNLSPGRLIIPDAGLRLLPGQIASVESLSPQTLDMIAKGYLAKLGDTSGAIAVPKSESGEQASGSGAATVREDYENLSAAKAIGYVTSLNDSQLLRAVLKREKRKTVIEAINERLAELG